MRVIGIDPGSVITGYGTNGFAGGGAGAGAGGAGGGGVGLAGFF